MAIHMRGPERVRILSLMEQEYPTPSAAAADMLRSVAGLLADRGGYAVAVPMDGVTLVWGPWYDLGSARRSASVDPDARVLRLHSPAGLERRLVSRPSGQHCRVCGHPHLAHVDRSWRPHRSARLRGPGCMIAGCDCKETS